MEIRTLIRSANRIGDFFESMPDKNEAAEGIANHIQKNWEPRMRRFFLDFLAEHPDGRSGENQLHPFVLETVLKQRQRLTPAAT
jgi:formate dehydrogenase subunit delta